MIYNFMCERCAHYMVCGKASHVMKFHDTAKKDLCITIEMKECLDYDPLNGAEKKTVIVNTETGEIEDE